MVFITLALQVNLPKCPTYIHSPLATSLDGDTIMMMKHNPLRLKKKMDGRCNQYKISYIK